MYNRKKLKVKLKNYKYLHTLRKTKRSTCQQI